MDVLNDMIKHTFERIASEASKLLLYKGKATLTDREICTAVRYVYRV